jgi:hypothetical protein
VTWTKLQVTALPAHEAYFSTLNNENIAAEDYQLGLHVWQENDMKTMNDFLVWYNNKDVDPCWKASTRCFFSERFNPNHDAFCDDERAIFDRTSTCSRHTSSTIPLGGNDNTFSV